MRNEIIIYTFENLCLFLNKTKMEYVLYDFVSIEKGSYEEDEDKVILYHPEKDWIMEFFKEVDCLVLEGNIFSLVTDKIKSAEILLELKDYIKRNRNDY